MTPSTTAKRIVLVGHCGPDSAMLKIVISKAVPGATIASASKTDAAFAEAGKADLLLVNRALDGDFEDPTGIELIARLAQSPDKRAALMLVSNYENAQAKAVQAGAVEGFGKSAAGSAKTAELIRNAVAVAKV